MKANRIDLLSFRTPAMRAFHVAWASFFLCFFGWFGIAPLMPVIRAEFALTKEQVGNIVIASVAATVLARLGVGWLCDRFGPRRVYAGLLVLGSLPVMGIGLSHDYASFLAFRFAIGAVGASFVLTQAHTTAMFAPNVVGTANATAAGWGNLGGGVAQAVMPLVFAAFVGVGFTSSAAWRVAMIVPGVLMLLAAAAYLLFTQDTPEGRFKARSGASGTSKNFVAALRDGRTWILAFAYGACFGVELTVHNVAALYFHDRFQLDLKTAGLVAGSFGVLALFARTLGGFAGDRIGKRLGLKGRVATLATVLAAEGIALLVFSRMNVLPLAVISLVVFGLFTHMSAGATYAVAPFVRRDAVGAVAGIIGAGGNAGAVAAGFLFRSGTDGMQSAFLVLGVFVLVTSALVLLVRFSAADEASTHLELSRASGARDAESLPAAAE
ncbi:MAG TPA: MFS transporter [Polyangiaceae bacterium]|nr:MFS transporter [Polyangiaceae bacterium]